MRRAWFGAGALLLSGLISGCSDDAAAPPTPEKTQSAVDAVKKLQGGAMPTPGGMKPAAEVKTNTPTK